MKPRRNSRRSFVSGFAALGAASAVPLAISAQDLGSANLSAGPAGLAAAAKPGAVVSNTSRLRTAWKIRTEAAAFQTSEAIPAHAINGDDIVNPSGGLSYSKGILQNALGEPNQEAYKAFKKACASGSVADFNAVVMGGTARFVNPQAAHAYVLEGADPHQLTIAAPPAFSSAAMAADMAEVYWRALARDVPFTDYANSLVVIQACDDLTTFSAYPGVKLNGRVMPANVFRGQAAGDVPGPLISQFLWKPIPYGGTILPQLWRTYLPGSDHLTTYSEWLNLQNGIAPSATVKFDPTARYIRNLRDLAAFVRSDYPYEAFLNAAAILQGLGGAVASSTNPYAVPGTTTGFVNFGPVMVFDLVARVASAALKAAWFQKWVVHRRIRPEQFGGRVHNHVTGAASYPLHQDLLKSKALGNVFGANGNYLLPMAYPEGAPLHPAYPAGHAAIAGACATVLKALFNEKAVLADPVMASSDGLALQPVSGVSLTVGGELDKLAANISLGRDAAGVHYRTDGIEGMLLGEKVAMEILRDHRRTLPERYPAFLFTGFSGAQMVVA